MAGPGGADRSGWGLRRVVQDPSAILGVPPRAMRVHAPDSRSTRPPMIHPSARIHPSADLEEGVVLGDRVKIQNAALVYHGVTVGNGVFIGPGAILTNDRNPRAVTATGDLASADDWTVTPIHLGDGASIGAGAVIVAGSDVGPYAMVGAGAVVTHPVPGYALVVGNPAHRIGWVCACGARLTEHESGRFTCPSCQREYVYLPDRETLEERTGPVVKQGAPA